MNIKQIEIGKRVKCCLLDRVGTIVGFCALKRRKGVYVQVVFDNSPKECICIKESEFKGRFEYIIEFM